jgi:prepilin-type N-terminal cleavage/methylation domain-containing protein
MLKTAMKQDGVTLVEFMIASAIGLIAIAAVLTVYTATLQHSRAQLTSARIHQQLFSLLQLMSADMRRAGYWQFDPPTQSASDNPFMQAENRLRSDTLAGEHSNSCLLFAYDLDQDGLVGVGQCDSCTARQDSDNVEQFGFRLHDFSLQSRYGGEGLSCDGGYWQTLNDPDIEINQLVFSITEDCTNLYQPALPCVADEAQVQQRFIRIELAAQLVNQPETAISLSSWLLVRNDRLTAGGE